MNDTLYILYAPIGMATQHPIFYNMSIYIPYKIFYKIFSNMNFAFFLLSFSQLLICSTVITIILKWFDKTFKNRNLTIFLSLYYIFVPIIADYNVTIIKDSIFNIIMLANIPILYNIIVSNCNWFRDKKNIILTTTVFSLTVLIRNNGLYIVLFTITILIFVYKKYLKNWLVLILTVIIISRIPNIIIPNKTLFQEKVGILMQQMAYTYFVNGKMSNDDKSYIEKWFKTSNVKDHYSPYFVDEIKWNSDFDRTYMNNHKKEFIKSYINLLPNNFESYTKSYLLATYGNWGLTKFSNIQSRFLGLDCSDQDASRPFSQLHREIIFPYFIQNFLERAYETFVIYLGSGVCLWVLLYGVAFLIYKENTKMILLSVPVIGNFITLMLASPLSVAFRYSSSYAYIIPIVFLILFIEKDSNNISNSKS